MLRLNTISNQDKESISKLQHQLQESENLQFENENLKLQIQEFEMKVEDLQQMIDASSSYEDMIESLTDQKMKLENEMKQLRITVDDFEKSQEIMEELDLNQREVRHHVIS